jgi:hypothetical protein
MSFQEAVERMLNWFTLALHMLFGFPIVPSVAEEVYLLQDYDDGLQNAAQNALAAKVIQCWAHVSKAMWAKIIQLFEEESRQIVYDDIVKLHNRTCNVFFHYHLKLFYKKYSVCPDFKNYVLGTYDRNGAKCTWHLGECLFVHFLTTFDKFTAKHNFLSFAGAKPVGLPATANNLEATNGRCKADATRKLKASIGKSFTRVCEWVVNKSKHNIGFNTEPKITDQCWWNMQQYLKLGSYTFEVNMHCCTV